MLARGSPGMLPKRKISQSPVWLVLYTSHAVQAWLLLPPPSAGRITAPASPVLVDCKPGKGVKVLLILGTGWLVFGLCGCATILVGPDVFVMTGVLDGKFGG